MSIIYILIPLAVLLTALGIYLFFWAVKTEQFEDLEKQGMSILFDSEKKHSNTEDKKNAHSIKESSEKSSKESSKESSKKNTEQSAIKK